MQFVFLLNTLLLCFYQELPQGMCRQLTWVTVAVMNVVTNTCIVWEDGIGICHPVCFFFIVLISGLCRFLVYYNYYCAGFSEMQRKTYVIFGLLCHYKCVIE